MTEYIEGADGPGRGTLWVCGGNRIRDLRPTRVVI